MRFAALSSGSYGNCFYIAEKNQSILIDAGISCRQIFTRLANLGENPYSIKGIFITHEHTDHIRGLHVLSKTLNVPIFATSGTLNSLSMFTKEDSHKEISENEIVNIAGMDITSFSKSHDAKMPVSFSIKNKKTISIITDIGYACKNIENAIEESDSLVIESNHDIDMLNNGPYPYFLKKRILSDIGHISNHDSAISVLDNSQKRLKNIVLAHLSETNNTPALAMSCFKKIISERKELKPNLIVSNRYYSTHVMKI